MNQNEFKQAFMVFHVTLTVVILITSVIPAATALGGEPIDWHLFILASSEVIAAVLFIIPATTRLGGWLLISILLYAFIAHSLVGEFELHLLVYAAGAFLVSTHPDTAVNTSTKREGDAHDSQSPTNQ